MPQFTVPKFIEHEAKIVGPLTFKQFIFIGIAGAICFILYFTVHFFIFLPSTIVIMLGAFGLAFLKSKGRSLPTVIKNFFTFSITPKMYLWKKKGGLPPIIIGGRPIIKQVKKAPEPKVAEKSRLKDLSTQIETKQ